MHAKGFLRDHSLILSWLLRTFDWLIIVLSALVAHYSTLGIWPPKPAYITALVLGLAIFTAISPSFNLYRNWRGSAKTQELGTLIGALTMTFLLLALITFVTKSNISRAWALTWFSIAAGCLIFGRLVLRSILNKMRALGFNQRHIVILGSGQVGQQVAKTLADSIETGFNIKAFFTNDTSIEAINDINPHLKTGKIKESFDYISNNHVDQVWIAMPISKVKQIQVLLKGLAQSTADIRLVPDIFGFQLINQSVGTVAGLPVVNLSVTPMDGANRYIKAFEDKLLAALILLAISPLLLLIAIAVKLTSRGPIFYRQERLTWYGKSFYMYKFRSMPVDAETKTGAVWAKAGERRATPFGRFLRRTSLDELPQFWNVLKGDMSIVGPRPERPMFVEKFKDEIPGYMQKHKVKAGITGWAQVHGWRGDTDLAKRIEHDLHYIENWSLWLDIKIIFLTIFKGFINKNAY
ncbi:MAG: undecaprenyl-phosphate glucose phosphotransferase [Pseudomonadales bacterium]|nr:undecaprenyl-phosphate glucose phosphotransferase [Pseudomonadales bacterium]